MFYRRSLTLTLLFLFPTSAFASFTIFDLPGAKWTAAASINNSGVVAGYADDSPQIPFVRTPDGTITPFSVPGTPNASAVVINKAGAATGWGCDETDSCEGFIRTADGIVTTFAPDTRTFVRAINKKGAVLGYSLTYPTFLRNEKGNYRNISIHLKGTKATIGIDLNSNGDVTGFIYQHIRLAPLGHHIQKVGFILSVDNTVVTFQGPNSSTATIPCCINEKGWVAGNYIDPTTGKQHGFIRAPDGTIVSVDAGDNTSITGLNDKGTVVGTGIDNSRTRGFVRRLGGKIRFFDAEDGATATYPSAINDNEEIVGSFHDSSTYHAFVGTP